MLKQTLRQTSSINSPKNIPKDDNMNEHDRTLISTEIAPLVGKGDLSLLLGAGFSVVNTTIKGRLPGGEALRDLILAVCGKTAGKNTTLKDAYVLGMREITNFPKFLAECFTVQSILPWQEKLFHYSWNKIYTTNIDNVLNVAFSEANRKGKTAGDFTFFNYSDPSLVSNTIGSIPVVTIHGTCKKLDEGFIFSTLKYAKASNRVLDWHRDLAAKMMTGGVIVVGNQMDETDFDSYLVSRESAYGQSSSTTNWIVLPNPDEIKAANYLAAGYRVIDATAEEFFQEIFNAVKPKKIADIVLETIPSFKRAATNIRAMTWFRSAFKPVATQIEKATGETGVFRHFITGADPDWFYIVNGVHAKTSRIRDLVGAIGELMQTEQAGVGVLHVTGPSGSGKTTTIRAALETLVSTYSYIYEFDDNQDIDTTSLRDILQNFTEKSIFVFYSAADYYFAVNFIADRVHGQSRPYCLFVLEDRTNDYLKSHKQISGSHSQFRHFEMNELSLEDAICIAQKIEEHGLKYEGFSELSTEKRGRKILDKERGFSGDLLSALFSLTTHENFEQKIYQEYHNVGNGLAKKVLDVVAIVQSVGFQLPISYIAGFLDERMDLITKCLSEDLAGVLVPTQGSGTVRCRHRIIANYYFENCIARSGQTEVIVGMLEFLSRQFSIDDIKYHPLAYRIYKELISFEFIFEKFFPPQTRRADAERTYHEAQRFFGKDGVFWLHFGRYYRKTKRLEQAIDCFRTGLSFYDSFQTRHSLGAALLAKYIADGCLEISLYEEGVELLENERLRRGSIDAYPTTALFDQLVKILSIEPSNVDAENRLKDCVNFGLKHFADDDYFKRILRDYLRKGRANLPAE